ncbi:MAG: hypothetical protein Q4B36_06540 [Tissierellia bacterium]|nr:hypothetical protein [Tissierellia bacterium]
MIIIAMIFITIIFWQLKGEIYVDNNKITFDCNEKGFLGLVF